MGVDMTKSVVVGFVSVIVAMTITTGALTLGLAIMAAVHGQNLVDLYLETFPQVRGLPVPFQMRGTGYAVFFLYVVGAAQLAIVCRRFGEHLR